MISLLAQARSGRLPKAYADLVALHAPRPIHDKVAYENAVEIVDALAGHTLNADQSDYLDLLGDLIEAYETEHVSALSRLSPKVTLQHLLNDNDLTGDDLALILNVDRSAAYKILKGSRNLTTDHIRRLCDRFAVQADLFI